MKMTIVSVFDSAIGSFGRPVFVAAIGQAVRSFTDEVNRGEGDISKHPEDFQLYKLGYFHDDSGQFETHIPEMIVQGASVNQQPILPVKGSKQ